MSRSIVLAFVAMFAGCTLLPKGVDAPAPTKTEVKRKVHRFYVDNSFAPYGVELISRACKKWETYSNGIVKFEVIQDLHKVPTIVPVMSTWAVISDFEAERQCATCKTLGLTIPQPTPIVLLVMDRLQDIRDFYEVTMHEIGHAIGLRHVTDIDSLMYADHQIPNTACPHKADMVEFCRVYSCDLSEVKWCD